mmetsp:Transcript_42043/g.50958  ORF Transcript_42043/g.50958 Transcript_42043/m.50958 type:complete len:427 (+) Transcript_42043:112-1392(+)
MDRAENRLANLAGHLAVNPTSASASVWSGVPQAPPDPILGVSIAYQADKSSDKLNLGVGAYRTEEGKPLLLNIVSKVEQQLTANPARIKEYHPMGGKPEFCELSRKLILGDCAAIREGRVATVQSLSGTGALRIAGEFLAKFYKKGTAIYLPDPTWGNHKKIFPNAGVPVMSYRYYDPKTRGLNFEGMCADLLAAPDGSIICLHACAHNPTGVDPRPDQWEQILRIVQQKHHLPLFDSAYQGFASGDLDKDAAAVRLFVNAGLELVLCQSYAKNMGLYGERVGAMSVVCSSAADAKRVKSQVEMVIRPMYSNPPRHGADIVTAILSSPENFNAWKVELKMMADRIIAMRTELHAALLQLGTPGTWNHVIDQIGMFTYTGLTKKQVENMTKKWHVYMTADGRISMAGLSSARAGYLAKAIDDSVRNC